MNRNLIVILFVFIVGGGITALVLYNKQYTPKYSWYQFYNKNNTQPYGLSLFYELLKKQKEEPIVINRRFYETLDTNTTNSNFITFGQYLYLDTVKADYLLAYIAKGNNVLIASNSSPLEMLKYFAPVVDSVYDFDHVYDSLVTIDFTKADVPYKKRLSFHFQFLKDTTGYSWKAYHNSNFNDSIQVLDGKPISYLNGDYVNCFYVEHGKGKLIIHSNPILFTNYNLIQRDGFEHVNNILSQLNSGPVYWDETSQDPSYNPYGGGESTTNPLQFLFSHYTLRWGWYLLLITVLLYLLFRSKREQRIIPILHKNTNTTIAYIKAVGVLYFQKGEHKNIANEMYTLFLAEVRNKYHFDTNIEEKELIGQISIRSEIKTENLERLFKLFRKVRFSPMANSKDLINLHNEVDFYYKNCK
jgi:hypothetical protein